VQAENKDAALKGRRYVWHVPGLYTRVGIPPSPCFSQVLILKEVKVLCFDTLLQVLILRDLALPVCWRLKKRLLDCQASRTVSGRSC